MISILITLNKKVVLIAIISILLSVIIRAESTSVSVSASIENVVGVDVGDWVKYDIAATWVTNVSEVEPPAEYFEINNITWVKNTVLAISGTKITFQRLAHYNNGSETESTEYVDVETGDSSEIGVFMFIPRNLTEGSIVHASLNEHYSINETVVRTYMGVTRETNHLNVSTVYDDPEAAAITVITANYYWDKATGILCERPGLYVAIIENVLTSLAISETIVDTNLWESNIPPVAEAGPDQTTIEDTSVSFDASASHDPDGTIVSYEWDFGDGTNGIGITTTHIYKKPGTYVVTLTVKDATGNTSTDTMTVNVTGGETFPSSLILGVSATLIGVLAVLLLWIHKGKKLRRSKCARVDGRRK